MDLRERPIVAIDGEGSELEGRQVYSYLASSSGRSIRDPGGLSTRACLDFLLREREREPEGLFVVYGGGYDVNMMLADVPRHLIHVLWSSERSYVVWEEFGLHYRPNRMFTVSRFGVVKGRRRKVASVTVWDALGYSQAPFVEAVRSWLGDDPRVGLIQEGKARRGAFDGADESGFVERYTGAELSALVDIERRMMGHLLRLDIPMKRHDGAGALASALHEKHGTAPDRKAGTPGVIPDARVPLDLRRAAAHAYFGGRIELVQYGRAERLFAYDVRSAYPAAMASLADWSQGRWAWRGRWKRQPSSVPEHSLCLVRWSTDERSAWGPLPFRELWGGVKFPPDGEVWAWGPEVNAALRRGDTRLAVLGMWEHLPDEPTSPFAWVADMYQQRARMKAAGDHAEKVLKLGLNSLYGKLAQRLGYQPGTGRMPKFHSMMYAGYITSWTRAKLAELASAAPESIVFFATDGVLSTEALPAEVGTELGRWEHEVHDEAVCVQSGVYFLRQGEDWLHRYRGWGSGVLEPEAIVAAWDRGDQSITVPVTRFVGMGRALASDWSLWRTWHTEDRTLALHPCAGNGKRRWGPRGAHGARGRRKAGHPSVGLVRTRPRFAYGEASAISRSPWDADLFGGMEADRRADAEIAD